MGIYLNPFSGSKEVYLAEHGTMLQGPMMPDDPALALVCLIQNTNFSAAGVCYSQYEMDNFVKDGTRRHRDFYWIPKQKVLEAVGSDSEKFLKEVWGMK